jgi:predicted RNase H-like nuclease
MDLIGESDEIDLDDVLDAIVLGFTSTHAGDQLRYLPDSWVEDPRGLPMRMAFQEADSMN